MVAKLSMSIGTTNTPVTVGRQGICCGKTTPLPLKIEEIDIFRRGVADAIHVATESPTLNRGYE